MLKEKSSRGIKIEEIEVCVKRNMTFPDTALADCYQCLQYCKKTQERILNSSVIQPCMCKDEKKTL